MNDTQQTYLDGPEPPPTWDEMREEGGMVVDLAEDKFAAYVGGDGHIVLMSQGFDDAVPHFRPIHCDDVRAFIAKLEALIPQAEQEKREAEARWEAAEREHATSTAEQGGRPQ